MLTDGMTTRRIVVRPGTVHRFHNGGLKVDSYKDRLKMSRKTSSLLVSTGQSETQQTPIGSFSFHDVDSFHGRAPW